MLLIEHDMPLITSHLRRDHRPRARARSSLQDVPDVVISDPRVVSAYLGGDIGVINRSGAQAEEPAVDGGAEAAAARPSPRRAVGR